jgi:hypothetical protein
VELAGGLLHRAGGLLDRRGLIDERSRERLDVVLEGAARVVDDAAEAAELLFAVPRLGLGAVDALVELAGLGLAGLHLEVRLLAVRLGRLDLELQALAHGAGLADLAAQGLELAARAGPFFLQLVPLGLGVVEGLGGRLERVPDLGVRGREIARSAGELAVGDRADERRRDGGRRAFGGTVSPHTEEDRHTPAQRAGRGAEAKSGHLIRRESGERTHHGSGEEPEEELGTEEFLGHWRREPIRPGLALARERYVSPGNGGRPTSSGPDTPKSHRSV